VLVSPIRQMYQTAIIHHYYTSLQCTVQFSILFVAVCDGGTYYIKDKLILRLKLSLYIILTFYIKKLF